MLTEIHSHICIHLSAVLEWFCVFNFIILFWSFSGVDLVLLGTHDSLWQNNIGNDLNVVFLLWLWNYTTALYHYTQNKTQQGTLCTLFTAWISNQIHYKMWGEIPYPFPNFNGATVEVWEWIRHFFPHQACDCLSMLVLMLNHVSKRAPDCTRYMIFYASLIVEVVHAWTLGFSFIFVYELTAIKFNVIVLELRNILVLI